MYTFDYVYLVPIYIYILIRLIRFIHMFQQNSYITKRYFIWIGRNLKICIPFIDLFVLAVFNYYSYHNIFSYDDIDKYFAMAFSALTVKHLLAIAIKKSKKKLVFTSRVKRLIFTGLIFIAVPMYLILRTDLDIDLYFAPVNFYAKLSLLALFVPLYILIINYINYPFETLVRLRYKLEAVWILRRRKELLKIGITGSYGKTSSKNIIKEVLSNHYYILASPKSFNTPMGLTITVRNYLKPLHQMFIAEMGAYKRGEIKELARFIKPKYGVLTTIGPAHLESFGSIENIVLGKFELIENLPKDGYAILNYDDDRIRKYEIKNNCNVLTYSSKDKTSDLFLFDVEVSKSGTKFKVKTKRDSKEYAFETKLLGLHNVYNILCALTLAHSMDIDLNTLKRAVRRLKPIPNRLEIKDMGNYTIIDDAFNSNPVGSKMALDILEKMDGQKIIITPGMIELGPEQYNLNKKFGEYIADVCDEVVLVGKNQTKPIQDGLYQKGYRDFHIASNIKEAFTIVSRIKKDNAYILIENDLPDLFNE